MAAVISRNRHPGHFSPAPLGRCQPTPVSFGERESPSVTHSRLIGPAGQGRRSRDREGRSLFEP